MDPAEERRDGKRQKDHIDMLGFVADSEYGIPKRCSCGLEKLLMFVYVVTKANGLHYRQPWVVAVQEEFERLTKRVEEAEEVMLAVSNLGKQMDTLEVSELTL
ncbi:hypothetical protein Bca101_042630 [Brassica carinata]